MEKTYSVNMDGKQVGVATVKSQGLYCEIRCQCKIPDHTLCRLMLTGEGDCLDLGVCVPIGSGFGVQTRIPLKNLPAGTPEFEIIIRQNPEDRYFVPVDSQKEFAYLSHLQDACFGVCDGVAGVYLTTAAPGQQGSDQTP